MQVLCSSILQYVVSAELNELHKKPGTGAIIGLRMYYRNEAVFGV